MTNNLATDLDRTDSHVHIIDETDAMNDATASSLVDSKAHLLSEQQRLPDVEASSSQTSQDQLQGCILS